MSGWKAVLGLVSRSQEGAQRLSPAAKGHTANEDGAGLQGLKPEVCHHGHPFIRQDGGKMGFISFSSSRDKETWEVWIYKLNSGWWCGFVKENQIPSPPLLQIQKRGKRQAMAGPRSNRKEQENPEAARKQKSRVWSETAAS